MFRKWKKVALKPDYSDRLDPGYICPVETSGVGFTDSQGELYIEIRHNRKESYFVRIDRVFELTNLSEAGPRSIL